MGRSIFTFYYYPILFSWKKLYDYFKTYFVVDFFTFYSKCGFEYMQMLKPFSDKIKNVNTRHVLK